MVNSELVAPAVPPAVGKASCLPTHHSFPGVACCPHRPTPGTRHSSSLAVPDRGYSSALAAANRFLQAWQNQDHETGLLMLTDAAKQTSSQERMESFFSSGNDAAYEIARGRKLKAGRYAFPVRCLFRFRLESSLVVRRDRRSLWFAPAKTNGQSTNCPSLVWVGHSSDACLT